MCATPMTIVDLAKRIRELDLQDTDAMIYVLNTVVSDVHQHRSADTVLALEYLDDENYSDLSVEQIKDRSLICKALYAKLQSLLAGEVMESYKNGPKQVDVAEPIYVSMYKHCDGFVVTGLTKVVTSPKMGQSMTIVGLSLSHIPSMVRHSISMNELCKSLPD